MDIQEKKNFHFKMPNSFQDVSLIKLFVSLNDSSYNKSNIFNVGTSIGLSRTQIVEKIKKVLEGCDIHINYIKN